MLDERFESNAAKHPQKAAIVYARKGDWETVTYAQLRDLTHRITRGLVTCRVEPNMRVALMTPPSVAFFALALAMLKLGVVPIVIDPAIGIKSIGECLNEAQPDVFIGNAPSHFLRTIFGWGKNTIKINTSINQLLRASNGESSIKVHQPSVDASSPAAVIYTSGSTGLPKGAFYTRGNLSAQMDMLRETFRVSSDEIDLPAFPLYALIDVVLGVTSVIPDIRFPVPKNTDPEKVTRAIQQFNVTNMFASPVVLEILANRHRDAIVFPSLKRVITAGAPAPIRLQERFRRLLPVDARLFGVYGATEALPIAVVESAEILNDARYKTEKGAGVCLGKPVSGVKVRMIRISDSEIARWEDSLAAESNVVGEITVEGPAVTRSYLHRDDANRLSKIHIGDDAIHRMGDVGYFDERGRLWYCGRKSHRVITRDETLFTEQIEGIFNAHPLVYRTALVCVDEEPALWVELEKDAKRMNTNIIKRELIALAKDHAQASKIKLFFFHPSFPTDIRHNSKILRERLTDLARQNLQSL